MIVWNCTTECNEMGRLYRRSHRRAINVNRAIRTRRKKIIWQLGLHTIKVVPSSSTNINIRHYRCQLVRSWSSSLPQIDSFVLGWRCQWSKPSHKHTYMTCKLKEMKIILGKVVSHYTIGGRRRKKHFHISLTYVYTARTQSIRIAHNIWLRGNLFWSWYYLSTQYVIETI